MNRSTLSICLLILVLLLAIQFDSPLIQYLDPAGDTRISLTPNRDFTTLENKECANVTDAIWTYPYMPENLNGYRSELKSEGGSVFFCSYSWVCLEIRQGYPTKDINLRELTRGTPYESFVAHHFYYKVLHGKDYIHHVQSVATCAMILHCGVVPKLMIPRSMNNSYEKLVEQCLAYDPTKTSFAPIFRYALAPHGPDTKPYAILGYDSRVAVARDANSGDEVQALAGLQFLPEHTMTVDRDNGYSRIQEGSSPLLVANAWYGVHSAFPPPLPTETRNNNIVFTSVHLSGKGKSLVTGYKEYWQKYISHLGPVGARDIPTLEFLQQQGLSSYLSLCFTLTFQIPRLSSSTEEKQSNEILVVDVAASANLPPEILTKATQLECNIPDSMRHTEKARHEYAHNLLSAYANRASVVITSRIHSALPATALGIPVIFVEDKHLPGGGGRRTEGISNLFHVQDARGEWQYGNLSEPLPPVPGVHRIDRYRASFWGLLKQRSHIFEETARLYGMIPIQRLGRTNGGKSESYHDLFHFIFTSSNMNWKMIRAIEYVFYHHPNAKVMIHCKTPDRIHSEVNIFFEAGYDLVTRSYNIEQMLRDIVEQGNISTQKDTNDFIEKLPGLKRGKYWYSHESDILRFLILYIHGGVYFDIDVYCLKTLEKKNFVNVVGEQGQGLINGAVMIFEPQHDFLSMALQWIISHYNTETSQTWGVIGPNLITDLLRSKPKISQSLTILDEEAFQPVYYSEVKDKCFEGNAHLNLTNTRAMHLNNKVTSMYLNTKAGTPCDEILHRFCIFCHEIHTVGGATSHPNSRLVTFPKRMLKEHRQEQHTNASNQ